jgi:hypothetical protein
MRSPTGRAPGRWLTLKVKWSEAVSIKSLAKLSQEAVPENDPILNYLNRS